MAAATMMVSRFERRVTRRARPMWRVHPGVPADAPLVEGGAASIVPAPASVAGLDEGRQGLRIYRCTSPGQVGPWTLRRGAKVMLSQRSPEAGDLVAIATRTSVRLAHFEAEAATEGRLIGVAEGIISDARG